MVATRPRQEVSSRPIAKVATGVRGLDDVLDGGLPAGRVSLVCGGPGTGKTVLALEVVVHGAMAGEPGLFMSFEESAQRLRANASSLGLDLEELEGRGMLRLICPQLPLRSISTGSFDLGGLLAIVDSQLEEIGARRLALDAIDQLTRLFGDPAQERIELETLHRWMLERGITAVLTSKHNGADEAKQHFLEFMVDCVLHLDQRTSDQVRTRRLQVVKYRGSGFLSNEHPYSISKCGLVFLPVSAAGLAPGRRRSSQRLSSGLAGLDEVLGGGFLDASSVVVSGETGTGKTTLAVSFARAACERGDGVLYVSLEESADGLVDAMTAAGVLLGDHVESGRLHIQSAMPEACGSEQHLAAILDAIDTTGARCLVVDAISAMHRMGSDQAAFDMVVRLLDRCRLRSMSCMLIDQVKTGLGMPEVASMRIASLVDTAILLSYVDTGVEVERRVVVLKSRGSAHSRRHHRLVVDAGGPRLEAVGEPSRGGAGRGTFP